MRATKIEHLLRFPDTADERAGEAAATEQKAEGVDGERLLRRADEGEVAVAAEQVDIGVDVVRGGDGVEDKIQASGVLLHLVGIAGDDDFVCAETERVVFLAGRRGENNDVCSQRMGKLHAHVAQSAETYNADFLALDVAPAAYWRVGRDPCAEKRRNSGQIEVGGDAQNEAFVDYDAIGVAAIGDASEVLVRGVEGESHVRTELLDTGPALGAGAVGVNHASDGGEVAGLKLGDRGAGLGDTADDLMSGYDWVNSGHEAAPLVTHLVEVGVADTAEQNFDLNVVLGWSAPRYRCGGER